MGSLYFFLLLVTIGSAVRPPPSLPFPYREDLDFLTSDEEERLIHGRDMSVIEEKIQDIPDQRVEPPNPDALIPMPTMDPPLPPLPVRIPKKRPPKKSNRGFPFKIPRALSMLSMMTAPLKRKPRMRSIVPVPTYRARPSTLVSSDPDQLEMAFKRIEIMASRAGLNMSSMPRSTQLQVVKRLVPKLPPRMSTLVKTAIDSKSDKVYHYLPEPIPEPVIHEVPDFSSYHIVHDDFEESVPSIPSQGNPFDAGKVSITASGEGHHDDDFPHMPGFIHSSESGPSSGLLPPSDVGGHGDYSSHSNYDRGHHGREFTSIDTHEGKIFASPLVSDFHEVLEVEESKDAPVIISSGSPRGTKSVKVTSVKSVTLPPFRVSLPTKDKISTARPTPRPIRVSIISKDTISTNRTNGSGESVMKVIHIEPIMDEEDNVSAHVQEVRDEQPTTTTEPPTRPPPLPSRVKEISKDIIQEEEAKHKKERRPPPTASTTTTTPRPITTTSLPDLDKLDVYDDWTEDPLPAHEEWGDPFELTDEDIASTVAELKKYEEQGIFENSLEQEFPWRLAPHPLEYPDHPDHPKDSVEEVKSESPVVEKEKTPPKAPPQEPPRESFPKRPPPPFLPMRRPPFGMPRRPPMRRPFLPKRPPHHMRRPPRPPPGHRPFRINEVTVSEIPKEYNKECDYFSEELCLVVQDYPIEAISEAMEKHPASSSLLVKEPEVTSWVDGIPKAQENSYNFKHYFGIRRSEDETTHRHRDFAGEGGFLCPSKVAYGQVKKAKSSSTGEWKYVVNYADNTQTLRLEKCLSPGNTCSYVMPHYRTACTQVYNYHRLLAWDSEKGLHVDVFKVPTCCTCHVQGYYIPQQQHGFTPVRRRDQPPRLKFAPPRTPMGRGAVKLPPPGWGDRSILKPAPPVKAVSKPTPVPAHSSPPKDLKDDLHDLLAQYSALREKIAKKKNENIQVSYSVSMGNGTDSLRPKTRESRTSQYPTNLKPLLKLKKLTENLKKLNGTGKPLLRAKLKRPLARALLLARLNRKLKAARSRSLRGRALKLDGEDSLSKSKLQTRIQMLRTRLNKYNERRKGDSRPQQIQRTKGKTIRGNSTNQRLRLVANRPSKVNYSYHPIMDYFNSRPGKLSNST